MLVLTRKIHEEVVIDNRVFVLLTKLQETEATVKVYALEPFDARRRESFAKTERTRVNRTNFEFVLKPGESILINDDITVVFIVARTPEGEAQPKSRFGFEGPSNTHPIK